MLIAAAILRPYKELSMNLTVIFNEAMIAIIIGFSGVFMVKDMHNDTALKLGWVWVALASFTMAVNWVVIISMQIFSIFKKHKLSAEVKLSQKTTADHLPRHKTVDMSPDRKEVSQNGLSSSRYHSPPDKTIENCHGESNMFSPTQATKQWNTKEGNDSAIQNHYDNEVVENFKSSAPTTLQSNKKKRRKVSDIEDTPVGFASHFNIESNNSPPTRVLTSNAEDSIQQSGDNDFNISVQLMGEAEYPETPVAQNQRPPASRKGSDGTLSYTSSVRNFSNYGSNKNILRRSDLSQ